MSAAGSMYGMRQRPQWRHLRDCTDFISNAPVPDLLAMTAERLCTDKGLTDRIMRADVAVMLKKAQARERSRAA